MLVKLTCLLFAVLAADGANLSEKCPQLKNPVEPDLAKLSGLWHVVGFYPDGRGLSKVEFKGDAASYSMTTTVNETLSRAVKFVAGVDEENRKMLKPVPNSEDAYTDDGYMYLLGADYDKFSIVYSCFWNQRVNVIAIVLSRSKDVDEDTRKKIKNVLLEHPQLKELKDKFD